MAWLKMCHVSVRPSSLRICQPCGIYDVSVQRRHVESSSNYYDVLGLKPNASQSQIKSAYYKLSKLYHPDIAKSLPNAKERFTKLSTAYEVLGNPHKRALYDRKHDPSSFRPAGCDDIQYKDFLRRRGSFSPSHSAYGTSTRRPGSEFDKLYKQNYTNAMKSNWEVKKNAHYSQHRAKQTQAAGGSNESAMFGLIVTACLILMCFFTK